MRGEVRDFLRKGILSFSQHSPTILLVDALDEAGESEAKAIASDLKSLIDVAEREDAQLRICFSCRHYPQIILSGVETLSMDEANEADIHTVVVLRIDSATCFNGPEKEQLKSEILSKAAGNFQWAAVVSDMIIETKEKGDSFKVTLKNLQRAPPTLEHLYESLLDVNHEPYNGKQRQQMLKLFQWVAFAARPLTLEELQQAMALDCDMTEKSISEYQAKDTYIPLSDLKTKVKNLSRGLVHFVASHTGEIQAVLIHQSIVDFLVNGGPRFLITDAVADVTRLAHFQLSRSCLRYLSMRESREWIRDRDRRLPPSEDVLYFFGYAWLHWAFHAFCAKSQDQIVADESDNDLLAFFEWPNDEAFLSDWVKLRHSPGARLPHSNYGFKHPLQRLRDLLSSLFPMEDHAILSGPNRGARLVHMLAFLGLQSPLEYLAPARHSLSTRNSHCRQLNVLDSVGSPLVYALAGSQRNTVQFLIQAGVKLNPTELNSRPEWSPVAFACQNPDPEFIELLFSRGAKLSNRIEGTFALYNAIYSGNATAIKMLLDRGVDVNAPNDFSSYPPKDERPDIRTNPDELGHLGTTPLHRAIMSGNGFTNMLLDRGADPNARGSDGETPLHLAAELDDTSIVASLIESGALPSAINDNMETPLDIALQRGNVEVMEIFISAGCNIKARSERKDGKPPLHVAASSPNGAAVSFLIQQGADVNATCSRGTKALHWAQTSEAVERLIEAGMNIESRDCMRRTPLHLAVTRSNAEVVATLLKKGADVNATCLRGTTALHLVESSEVVERLVAADMKVEARDCMGCTPLHFAVNRGNAKVVAMLLEKGADAIVDAKSLLGETPLHHAESPHIVRLLIEAGANLESRDRWGRTPLYYAAYRHDYGIMILLRQKGADMDAVDYIGDSITCPEWQWMPPPPFAATESDRVV